jgi:hypothetical protein
VQRLVVDRQDASENEYANEFRMVTGFTFNWGRR